MEGSIGCSTFNAVVGVLLKTRIIVKQAFEGSLLDQQILCGTINKKIGIGLSQFLDKQGLVNSNVYSHSNVINAYHKPSSLYEPSV